MQRNREAEEKAKFMKKLFSESPDLAQESKENSLDKDINSFKNAADSIGQSFDSYAKSIAKASKDVFTANTKIDKVFAKKQLKMLEKDLAESETSGGINADEKEFFNRLISDIKEDRKQVWKSHKEFASSTGKLLLDKLPSIGGIAAAIGLDNPLFLFLGSLIQGVSENRKELKNREKALRDEKRDEENKLEAIRRGLIDQEGMQDSEPVTVEIPEPLESDQGLDFNSFIPWQKSRDKLLEMIYEESAKINESINQLIHAGQANAFEEMEREKESIRREESLIDAINGIGDQTEELNSKKLQVTAEDKGFLDALMGGAMGGGFGAKFAAILASFTAGLTAIGTAIAGFVAAWAAPLALLGLGVYGLLGAWEGFGNAAEKLGKDVDEVTMSDKIASALGGFWGKLFGIIDSITGLFGFNTEVGPWIDQKITEITAFVFDTYKNAIGYIKDFFIGMFTMSYPEGFSISAMLTAPVHGVINFFDKMLNFVLPETEFSLDKLVFGTITKIQNWFTEKLQVIMPEWSLDLTAQLTEVYQKVTDWIKELFTFELPTVDNFLDGAKKFLGMSKDVDEVTQDATTYPVKKKLPSISDRPKATDMISSHGGPPVIEPAPLDPNLYGKQYERNEAMNKLMYKNHIEQKQADKEKGTGAVIAPSTKNVNNINNSTSNSTSISVSPFDADPTFRMMNALMFL